ncbi:MAG: glycosyltransferase family 2 protein [Betaproteobacteria bacterium]|nr:glycosyltransferase family 2 protein [Betaproteobacteria bacterium]MBV9361623.1 glycosyltransferase family 2 protein [Betaproteobacteria bacterium]
MVELSVVVPVYGCRDCLRALHERTTAALRKITSSYEIVLVDDCDREGSWEVVAQLAREDRAVKAFRLSRNFGQHAAITAGLAQCTGRWAVVMDCDLQDPPELIGELYRAATAGNDVVLARRKGKRQSLFRRIAARLYFRLLKVLARARLDGEFGSFSIISRKVVDALLRFRDQDRHYLFILNWLGFRTATIEYEHASRHSGRSAYSLRDLVRHALNGLFFQTTVLLRWIVYLGFWISCAGFALAAYYVYMYFRYSVYPGFTSLAVLILIIGGFIIMSTGVAGLYIGKVFDQVKGRPLYVIDQSIVDGEPR